jgi:hypothetical protein
MEVSAYACKREIQIEINKELARPLLFDVHEILIEIDLDRFWVREWLMNSQSYVSLTFF